MKHHIHDDHEGLGWLVLIPLCMAFGAAWMIVWAMQRAAESILTSLPAMTMALH